MTLPRGLGLTLRLGRNQKDQGIGSLLTRVISLNIHSSPSGWTLPLPSADKETTGPSSVCACIHLSIQHILTKGLLF